jgi:hypothetical protein
MLLEQLQPFERAVFLLREVFEYEFAEIATFLGKSEAACRQWFRRAKQHLGDHRPRFPASPDTHRQLLTGFLQAAQAGEMPALMNLLAEEVTSYNTAPGGYQGRGIRSIAHARIIHTPSLRLSAPGRKVETHSIKIIQLQACLHLLVCSLDFLLRSHPICDQKGLYESVCL